MTTTIGEPPDPRPHGAERACTNHRTSLVRYVPLPVGQLLPHGGRTAAGGCLFTTGRPRTAAIRPGSVAGAPHALREYEDHYNVRGHHRGIANARPLRPLPQPITDSATIADLRIRRRDRLSGLIREYEHAA